jgi:cytochrome c-type biogenesis protein CcmH/NrfF
VVGAAMLVVTAFAPHAIWPLWLTPVAFVVWGAIFLFLGFNARRAARAIAEGGRG